MLTKHPHLADTYKLQTQYGHKSLPRSDTAIPLKQPNNKTLHNRNIQNMDFQNLWVYAMPCMVICHAGTISLYVYGTESY